MTESTGSSTPGHRGRGDEEIHDPGRDPIGLDPPRNPLGGGADQDSGRGRPEATPGIEGPSMVPEPSPDDERHD